jgi:hypothetical protein
MVTVEKAACAQCHENYEGAHTSKGHERVLSEETLKIEVLGASGKY